MKYITTILFLFSFLFTAPLQALSVEIAASVFPVWMLLRSVAQNVPEAHVSLILPASTGCPHDYAPTPQDRKKLATCDILVINGLGLESFLGEGERLKSILKKGAVVVDASRGCAGLLPGGHPAEGGADHPVQDPPQGSRQDLAQGMDPEHGAAHRHEEEHGHEHGSATEGENEGMHEEHEHLHDEGHEGMHGHEHAGHGEHGHHHDHGPLNPHIFASPSMMGQMAESVARQLADADPAHAGRYLENARAFRQEMDALAGEFRQALAGAGRKSALVQHNIFDYLARDAGLEIDGLIQRHEGVDPSARELLDLARLIRSRGTAIIITEPQYPARNGEMLARETGIPCISLDPVAGGPENAPLDHYARCMRSNLKILRQAFGIQK